MHAQINIKFTIREVIKTFLFGWLIFSLSTSAVCSTISNPTQQTKQFPASYEFTVKHDWLTMKDGVRLAATFYLPTAKHTDEKFPIVLEVLPYRKDDSFAMRDYPVYSYFARRGIAGVRVDIRGTGASFGRLTDREYSDGELNDIPVIIDQVAKLPWSNGNVGLQGKSWSAINGMITAMRNPSHLKATLFLHGSHDLYANDLHTIDGGLHFDMFLVEIETENMMPRGPDYPIDAVYFRDRFNVKPWIFNYLKHQQDGKFWYENRSLFTNYDSFHVPSYIIGGLLDGYRDFVPDMLANVQAPMRGEMGPWNHAFPHNGTPGPNYEWRQTAVRWWQHWLNNKDTNLMNEPPFMVFLRDDTKASRDNSTAGVFWNEDRVIEPDNHARFFLHRNNTLSLTPDTKAIHQLNYKADAGIAIGNWWGEVTGDVRTADEGALLYDSQPVTENKHLIGFPQVHLTVASNQPVANWVVRLEDISPDGTVRLVTGGLINGAHRKSRLASQSIIPGEFFPIDIRMRYTTWTFKKGHRIRLVVSNAQFPMIWPSPHLMSTQLKVGDASSEITLPFVNSKPTYPLPDLPKLEPVESRPDATSLHAMELTPFRVTYDTKRGLTKVSADESSSWKVNHHYYHIVHRIDYTVNPNNPAEASFTGHGSYEIRIGKRSIVGQTIIDVRSDQKNFYIHFRRQITENYKLIKAKEWEETIPRNLH